MLRLKGGIKCLDRTRPEDIKKKEFTDRDNWEELGSKQVNSAVKIQVHDYHGPTEVDCLRVVAGVWFLTARQAQHREPRT